MQPWLLENSFKKIKNVTDTKLFNCSVFYFICINISVFRMFIKSTNLLENKTILN